MDMETSVHVQEAVVITPSDPTPNTILSLSPLDSQLFLRFTIEYLFIYTPQSGSLNSSHFKAALSHALVPYYPLAGRIRVGPDGSNLEVVCRAQGAVFVEAVSDHNVSDFETAPAYVDQWRRLLSLHVADVLMEAPLLVVQLTWLNDGGAAVGVGLNHCMIDGAGSAEFLNLFADLAAGRLKPGEFKPKPVWDRHLLNPKPACKKNSMIHHEFNKEVDVCGFLTRFSSERLVPTVTVFNQRSLNQLKKVAVSTSRHSECNSSVYTSFEILSAHIWSSWARALNLPSNQILKLLFSINVRDRVTPSMPSGFYGNAFVLGCARTSVKDLTERGLGYAARLVRAAKERVDDEFVRTVIESVNEERASPDSVGVLVLSQWSRMGLERVDFGSGRPVHVGPICTDRYCLFLPVIDQTAAVKVAVAIPKSAVDKFEILVRSTYS